MYHCTDPLDQGPWEMNAKALELAERLSRLEGRHIVAIAGAPGSGKSTFTVFLAQYLNRIRPGSAEIVPMDGFHYDDAVLRARGTLDRKGAPFTFDVGGLAVLLGRLKANQEPEIAVPVFDRDLEISRAAARLIAPSTALVLVEGNYLLLDQAPWSSLRGFFDVTVFLKVPLAVLERRLMRRWIGHGHSPETASLRVHANDLENARTIDRFSQSADVTLGG